MFQLAGLWVRLCKRRRYLELINPPSDLFGYVFGMKMGAPITENPARIFRFGFSGKRTC